MLADNVVKYILEGLAVSIASHLVAKNRLNFREIALLGITAALVFMVLDQFSPAVSAGARQGSGFGVGYKLVGGGCGCAANKCQEGGKPNDVPCTNDICFQGEDEAGEVPPPNEDPVEGFRPYR